MAAGEAQLTEAQLTDLLSGVATGPGADQDGLTQSARTRPARTAGPPPCCRCRAPAWRTR
jgi:hypothetical protein